MKKTQIISAIILVLITAFSLTACKAESDNPYPSHPVQEAPSPPPVTPGAEDPAGDE
jgi:hypothetical protein